jgi:YD repeat-containing protein
VWVDVALAEHRAYDAANQVEGWQYDATGNLVNDGRTTYTYDALNRLSSRTLNGTTDRYMYNGDGVLTADTVNGNATTYTQDLAAPLAQVLQVSGGQPTTYLYGLERLAEVRGSQRTWYAYDALGSVRQVLNDDGGALRPSSTLRGACPLIIIP